MSDVRPCPICEEPGGFHNQQKHSEFQVAVDALLEPGWLDEEHKRIVKEKQDAKERAAQRPDTSRAAAARDLEEFAARSLEQVRAVAPQMTGCANRQNLATVETFRRAASIARVGMVHNENCTNCWDTRGGEMGHATEDCTWVKPEGMFEEHEQCQGDEMKPAATYLLAVAELLLSLKDGPRDEAYERAKPLAWESLRDAVSNFRLSVRGLPAPADGSITLAYDYETEGLGGT